ATVFVSYAVAGLSFRYVEYFYERHEGNARIRVEQKSIVDSLVQCVSGSRQAAEYAAPLSLAMRMGLLAISRGFMVGVFGVLNDRQIQRLPRYLYSEVAGHLGSRVPERAASVEIEVVVLSEVGNVAAGQRDLGHDLVQLSPIVFHPSDGGL